MARSPKTKPPGSGPATAKPRRKAGLQPAAELKPRAKTAKPRPAKATDQPLPPPSAPPEPEPQPTADQASAIEALSMNLARAAMTAQAAIAEAALRQADRPPSLSADPMNVTPALASVMTSLAGQPDRLIHAQADLFTRYVDLWGHAARRAWGEPASAPATRDKRFQHPDWSENPVFDVIKQSYLLTSDWLNGLVSTAEDVDPRLRRRAEFFTRMLTDAFSPSNFLASNPAALKALMETNGESLVKGMQNFAADMERGGGRLAISQADYGRFEVGVNVATAPGRVVWRDELFELLQFEPTTETQYAVPLLIFPPWINKYYILDLQPANSMIRWLTDQGFSVFICSWVNPDASMADYGFEEYLERGIYRAIEKVLDQTGQERLNTVGYCIGGTLMGAALAHMAARGDRRVGATTFFAAQHDFAEAGDLLLFTDEHWLREIEQRMDEAGGVLPGAAMADTFNALRANDLIWSFFVSNYLMGKDPPAFDLLFWNADQTRMPKRLHMTYLRRMYGENALARGEMEMGGERLDLSKVTIPLYFQASKDDHIAPLNSVYRSARLFGGPVTYTLAGSGHIAGVINPPSARKYQHWTNPDLPETLEDWRSGAVEHPGSWWEHWAAWLSDKSGDRVPARDPDSGPLPSLGPAPGTYVKVKS